MGNYTVSQDKKSQMWYAHMKGFPYVPYFGSFCEKEREAMEYAKMLNGLPHRVDAVEQKYKKRQQE